MNRTASATLKTFYCIGILSAIIPSGLANFGWVGLATGQSIVGGVPFIGPIFIFILGLYRISLVIRKTGTLDSKPVSGFLSMLRNTGLFFLYAGAVFGMLNWLSRLLLNMFIQTRSGNGIEYFVIGVYLSLTGGVEIFGLFMFEFSRLLAFEQCDKQLPIRIAE